MKNLLSEPNQNSINKEIMTEKPKHGFLYYFYDLVVNQLNNGVQLDTWVEINKKFLDKTCGPKLAKYLHIIFIYFLGHAILLSAILKYILVIYPMKHGNFKIPIKLPKFIDMIRSELTLFLLAFSVIFHINAWPALRLPFDLPFKWGFTLRPQINVKPQMTLQTKRSKSEIFLPTENDEKTSVINNSHRSKSCGDLNDENNKTSVDFSLGLKIRDGVTDKLWSNVEQLADTISLASGLSQSDFFKNSLNTCTSFSNNSKASSLNEFLFDEEELNDINIDENDTDEIEFSNSFNNLNLNDVNNTDEVHSIVRENFNETKPELDDLNDAVIVEFPDSDDDENNKNEQINNSDILIIDITDDNKNEKSYNKIENKSSTSSSEYDSASEVFA